MSDKKSFLDLLKDENKLKGKEVDFSSLAGTEYDISVLEKAYNGTPKGYRSNFVKMMARGIAEYLENSQSFAVIDTEAETIRKAIDQLISAVVRSKIRTAKHGHKGYRIAPVSDGKDVTISLKSSGGKVSEVVIRSASEKKD